MGNRAMHEMALATSLIEKVLETAQAHGLGTVQSVELEVGELMLVVPEAMELAFEAVCDGTIATGAKLTFLDVPARARCRACGREYALAVDHYQCPRCGKAEAQIIAGRDLILKTLSGIPQDETGGSV